MKIILDKILWSALLLLFGPTVMIVASWNALPGDNLYGVKLVLERTALAVASPSYATSGTLRIKYTERRFAEAKQLLASKQSIQGLPYLEQQIAETRKAIESAPNKEAQVALAKQYITTLSTVSTELEAQKQTITTTSQPIAYAPPQQTNTSTPTQTPAPTPTSGMKDVLTPAQPTGGPEVKKPTPSRSPSPKNTPTPIQIAQVTTTAPIPVQHAVVALQIDQARKNVQQTIDDLQTLVGKDDHGRGDNQQSRENEKRDEDDHEKKNDNDSDDNGQGKNQK